MAVTFFGSMLFRRFEWGRYSGAVAFIVFEGLGASRILTGLQKGMHKFEVLILMMAIGGLLYFFRIAGESSGASSTGSGCPVGGCSSCSSSGFWSSGCSSSSSSSSSCGRGGCGGGGGCGGCGGS